MLFILLLGITFPVKAATRKDKFYVAEEISGIYYSKEKDGDKQYRKAKYKRRKSDQKVVYCLEPFKIINEDTEYVGYDTEWTKHISLSSSDIERVKLLAYYGYGYTGHTADKWYPITQIMIWKTVDKKASFKWNDAFEGQEITKYEKEMQELDNLVKNHNKLPSINGKEYKMTINDELIVSDTNKLLSNYSVVSATGVTAKVDKNNLVIKSTGATEGTITLKYNDSYYDSNPFLYVNGDAQKILIAGKPQKPNITLKVKVESGSIKINKVDADTESTTSKGEGILTGAEYEVLDSNNSRVGVITIGDDFSGFIDNLKFGTYKIREIKAGTGYTLDDKEYEVEVNSEAKNVELTLSNKIITKEVKIIKYFGDSKEGWKLEKGIKFNIYNSKGVLIDTVETDEYGRITFNLPYGKYKISQVNTESDYEKVDDFIITVDESDTVLQYELKDIKKPVIVVETPDTNEKDIKKGSLFINILLLCGLAKFRLKNEN